MAQSEAQVPNGAMIQMQAVHKWYGDFHVLTDINLEVKKSEKVVVCGPSGFGKSTMIRCINRLEEHQQGRIVVAGIASRCAQAGTPSSSLVACTSPVSR